MSTAEFLFKIIHPFSISFILFFGWHEKLTRITVELEQLILTPLFSFYSEPLHERITLQMDFTDCHLSRLNWGKSTLKLSCFYDSLRHTYRLALGRCNFHWNYNKIITPKRNSSHFVSNHYKALKCVKSRWIPQISPCPCFYKLANSFGYFPIWVEFFNQESTRSQRWYSPLLTFQPSLQSINPMHA